MKSTKTVISPKVRKEINEDPLYQTCALAGYHGHECEGRVTREHAVKHKGKKVQEKWAIVPICAKGHAVDEFQDAGTMVKELNEWVAYCRATDDDILRICGDMPGTPPEFAKSKGHFQRKKYLIEKYGVWKPKAKIVPSEFSKDVFLASELEVEIPGENPQRVPRKNPSNKLWYHAKEKDKERIQECIDFYRKAEGKYFSPHLIIEHAIQRYHEDIIRLKEIADEKG